MSAQTLALHTPRRHQLPRGASRLVQRTPRTLSWPKPQLGWMKFWLWPLGFLLLALVIARHSDQLLALLDRPINKISVQGTLSLTSQQKIQKVLTPYAQASFFFVDMGVLREELKAIPGIARAQIRRIWPDQMVVVLEEQLPIARWGQAALLNNRGEAFVLENLAAYQKLPLLEGPERAQQKVMQQYQWLSQMLRPLGFSITRLTLHERGSWFVSTNQGIDFLLGRDDLVEKIQRFVVMYNKALKSQHARIAHIDLRYPNGVAVGWRHDPAAAVQVN